MAGEEINPAEDIQLMLQPPSQDISSAAAVESKADGEAPTNKPAARRYSTAPVFDLASSSSTVYIALPVPEGIPPPPESRGRLSSFFHRNLGLFLIASAQLFFATMNLCAKLLSDSDPPIHPLEIIFVRMLITWLGAITYLHYNKVPNYLIGPKGIRLLLVFRGIVGFFGLFGIYYSLQYLDLSDATVLTFLAPILTGYFGRIFLKEPFLRTELYAGILSFFGVILIARPQSLFGDDSASGGATGLQRLAAVGVALLGVLGAAAAYISIRAIGNRAHPLISVSMFALYATVVSAIGLVVLQIPFVVPMTFKGWAEWVVIGISGFVAQFLLTSRLQRERAGRGVTMVYLQMVFAFVFERLVWGVIPDFWSISGSGLILSGAIWVAIAKSRIKYENQDDLERQEYSAVNREDPKDEFELGDLDIDNEVAESSSSPRSPPTQEPQSQDIARGEEDINTARGGELE